MDQVVMLFQNYPFLQTEWFYTMLTFILAFCSAVTGIIMYRRDSSQRLKEEHMQTLSKIIENDLRMKDTYRTAFDKLRAFKGDSREEIFPKDVQEIQDEEIRASIQKIIAILSDVFSYYKLYESPIEETEWMPNFRFVFNPNERKVFVTAFHKYKEEGQFCNEKFISFVDTIINQSKTKQ